MSNDYFTAYRERMIRNDNTFNALAEDLKKEGCKVYGTNSGGLKSFIVIIKGNEHIILEFSEVPYRWRLYCQIEPTKAYGSARTIDTVNGPENEWTAKELINVMCPNIKRMNISHLKEI